MEVEPKRRKISLSGLEHTLYAWDQGSDTTILFLHGFLDVGQGFSFIVEALKDSTWNFLALDWRGHGRSSWVGGGGYYHFIDYVRDLEECVRKLNVSNLYVVGHSMGAMALTLWLGATQYPVKGAILLEALGPIPLSSEAAQSRVGQWLSDVNLITKPRHYPDLDTVVKKLQRLYTRVPIERIKQIAKWAVIEEEEGIRWRYDPLHRTRSPIPVPESLAVKLWQSICTPMLWIGGEESPWKGERLDWWLGLRPDLRRQRLPNAGHMLQYEEPEQTGYCIRSFIEKLSK